MDTISEHDAEAVDCNDEQSRTVKQQQRKNKKERNLRSTVHHRSDKDGHWGKKKRRKRRRTKRRRSTKSLVEKRRKNWKHQRRMTKDKLNDLESEHDDEDSKSMSTPTLSGKDEKNCDENAESILQDPDTRLYVNGIELSDDVYALTLQV